MRVPAVAAAAAVIGGALGVAAEFEITHKMVDADQKKLTDFEAAISRSILVFTGNAATCAFEH